MRVTFIYFKILISERELSHKLLLFSHVIRHYFDISLVGLLKRHVWSTEDSDRGLIVGILRECAVESRCKLVADGILQASQWTLVWFWIQNKFRFNNFDSFNSISGSTSAIFAYLGEFLGAKNRSRSMMVASVLFAVFCLLLPILAWLTINQQWSFIISLPLMEVVYKPWRLFLVVCGLPSLICGLTMIFMPESPKFTFSQVGLHS